MDIRVVRHRIRDAMEVGSRMLLAFGVFSFITSAFIFTVMVVAQLFA